MAKAAATKKKPVTAAPAVKKPTFEIIDCEQGSEEWIQARLGVPTASRFADILAEGQGKTRESYLNELAGEQLTGIQAEHFVGKAMERGKAMEQEACEEYERLRFDVTKVGFVRNAGLMRYATVGASPDRLVGPHGGLEVKTVKPELLIGIINRGVFPSEHRAQCQGSMWVCERKWWTLKLFYTGMPKCEFTIERDETYIDELRKRVEVFSYDLKQLVKDMRARMAGGGQ